ncbi:MAG: LacI family DNA-binding transcriptional regulator [Acidobacteriota bacterium]
MARKREDPGRSQGVQKSGTQPRKAVTLKDLAKHLELSPATVSVVLNRSPVADSIPRETQDRVFAAARDMKYRPNHLARSLRSRRTHTIGVLVTEIVEPYATGVLSGLESHLVQEGYFYLVASHLTRDSLLEEYVELMKNRLVEGLVLIATELEEPPGLPTVSVSGHQPMADVTNVLLDHDLAARLALEHLMNLGHERIAFFKGQDGNSDTADRWRGIEESAHELGLEMREDLCFQLEGDAAGSESRTAQAYRGGYDYARELLDRGSDFTALFAFNDVSAIGAMRAFVDDGLSVPRDISVVGFDDIMSAAFHNPGLTTVRQPLAEMGATAGRILLDRLATQKTYPDFVTVKPELIERGSTGPARQR